MVWACVPCYSVPFYIISRGRKKGLPLSLPGRKVAPSCVEGWGTVIVWGSSLYTFVINIVSLTVCFFISLLFPVNGAYSTHSPIQPTVNPFVLSAGRRGETTDSMVLVRALNWGIPFLNHDTSLFEREQRDEATSKVSRCSLSFLEHGTKRAFHSNLLKDNHENIFFL